MLKVIKKGIPYVLSIVIAFAIVSFVHLTGKYQLSPQEVYKVYLDGKSIGNIKDKQELEDYINDEQSELKKKYGVSKVYVPSGVDIQKCLTYEKEVLTAKQIHNKIKKSKPFTVKGYKITISPSSSGKKKIVINVLDKKIFDKSVKSVLGAFLTKDEINNYENNTQPEIKDTGSLIEDVYIGQDISIKKSYISTDDQIFTDEKTLTKYLMFGEIKDDQYYTVQEGDTIETIAYNHQLAPEEFLIVNPEFTSKTNLLSVGQQVKIGLINPILDIVVERHTVMDQEIRFQTEEQYDSTMSQGVQSVKTEGTNGLERLTTKIKTVNGQTTNVVIVSSETITPAINKVVVVGTKSIGSYNTTVIASGDWAWPTISQYYISSTYGYRWGVLHAGIDIAGCGYGSPVYAVGAGTVVRMGYNNGAFGTFIVINHNNGYYTIYEHLSAIFITDGQTVQKGQQIGAMGNSGDSTGTHLHLGLWTGGLPYKSGSTSLDPFILYK